jgi:hypothetical protein
MPKRKNTPRQTYVSGRLLILLRVFITALSNILGAFHLQGDRYGSRMLVLAEKALA